MESHRRADRPLNARSWTGPTPPVTPVRVQSNPPKITTRAPLYKMRDSPPLSPASYLSSQTSDQPPPAHDSSPTRSLELAGFNHDAQPLRPPRGSGRTSSLCHTHRDGVSEVADLHPRLAVIRCNESRLSHSGNEISKSFSFTVLNVSRRVSGCKVQDSG